MSATPGTKKPIGRWILLGLWCVLLFVIPSAAIIDRGAPAWVAAMVGALSFPLAPIAWHVVSERARKRRAAGVKVAAKATLTVADRFVLRTIAVALITCAPWFVIARGRTLRAVWHHATWPIDALVSLGGSGGGSSSSGLHVVTDQRLLQYVPTDAEGLIWMRTAPDLEKALGGAPAGSDATAAKTDDDDLVQGVIALKQGELFAVVVVKDGKSLDDIDLGKIDQDQARKWLGHELHLTKHRIANDTLVVVSDGWDQAYVDRAAGKTPPAKALIDLVGPAPADAIVVAAALPRETIADLTLKSARAWLRADPITKKLAADAHVRAVDPAGAAAFADWTKRGLAHAKASLPESCRESVGALLDGIHVNAKGDEVSIDTLVAPEQLMPVMFCGMSVAK